MIKIDEREFEQTAKAVYAMNPSSYDQYDSWEDLRSFMIAMAYQYMADIRSFSTGGFQLTSFVSLDEESVYVRPSVSSYVALKYVEDGLSANSRKRLGFLPR